MALSSPQDTFRLESVSHFLGSHTAAFTLPLPSPDGLLRDTRWLERWMESEEPDSPIERLGAGVVDDIPGLREYFARNAGFYAQLLFCIVAAYCLVRVLLSEAGPRLETAVPDMEADDPANVKDAPIVVRIESGGGSSMFLHFKLDVLKAMEVQLYHGAPKTGTMLVDLFLPNGLDSLICDSALLGLRTNWFFSIDMSTIFDLCPWDAYQSLKFREVPGVCRIQPENEDTNDDVAVDVDGDGWSTVVYRNRRRNGQPYANAKTVPKPDIRVEEKFETLAKTGDDARLRSRTSTGVYLHPKKGVLAGRGAVVLSSQQGRSVHASQIRHLTVEPNILQPMQESLMQSVRRDTRSLGASREQHTQGRKKGARHSDTTTFATSTTGGASAGNDGLNVLGRPEEYTDRSCSPAQAGDLNKPETLEDDLIPLKAATGPSRTHTRAYTAPAASRSSSPPSDQASSQRWPRSALRLPRGRTSTSSFSTNSASWRSRRPTMSSCVDLVLVDRTMATSGDSLTCFEVTLYSASADAVLGQHSEALTGDERFSCIQVA